MIKVLLLYFLVAGAIGGVLYGVPELRKFAIQHKRRWALAFGLGLLLVVLIYQLEAY